MPITRANSIIVEALANIIIVVILMSTVWYIINYSIFIVCSLVIFYYDSVLRFDFLMLSCYHEI